VGGFVLDSLKVHVSNGITVATLKIVYTLS
jgi:hypothetical protein